jgi:hypothetical protein
MSTSTTPTLTLESLQAQLAELQAKYPVAPKDPAPTGYGKLVCRKCHQSFAADDPNPHAGGCSGYAHEAHDFFGAEPVVKV